jgi:hypothetical protein
MKRLVVVSLAWLLLTTSALAQQPADPPADPPAEAPKIQAPDPDGPGRFQIGLALGPGLDVIVPTSGKASVAVLPRLSIRFPANAGWAPTVGFGWFDTDIESATLGRAGTVGELQLRPVMLGARYTWLRDALSYDVAATAGVSFSDFDLDGEFAATLPPGTRVRAEANTSFASKVQGGVWYDYNDRVSFRGTMSYFRCAPEVTVTLGSDSRRFKQPAHALLFGASVVYRIF